MPCSKSFRAQQPRPQSAGSARRAAASAPSGAGHLTTGPARGIDAPGMLPPPGTERPLPRVARICGSCALLLAVLLGDPRTTSAQGADDRAAAEAIVKQMEGDAPHAAVAAEALANARTAIERATRLRAAGDEAHAKAADGLAREWAESARDIARAADAEAAAAQIRRKAVDAQAQLERTRALVEEAIARVGRLTAELNQIERPRPATRPGGARSGDGPDIAGGSKAGGTPKAGAGRRAVEAHAAEPESAPAPKKKTPTDGKASGEAQP